MRSRVLAVTLAVAGFLALGFASCEEVARPNDPPRTYFQPGGEPPDTLVVDNFMFRWFGVDTDSDVSGYFYRMLINAQCDSATLAAADESPWVRVQDPRVIMLFSDPVRTPDGPYIFQARTEDEFGAVDEVPLTRCFSVYIQQPPICSITQNPPSRQHLTESDYGFTAEKRNRLGGLDSAAVFEYTWQFQQTMPSPEILVPWSTSWIPMAGTPPQGEAHVTGLLSGSDYLFQLKVRDRRFPEIESDQCRHTFTN